MSSEIVDWVPINLKMSSNLVAQGQVGIHDFTQEGGGGQLRGAPRPGPKVSTIKNKKVCGFGLPFLVGVHSPFYFPPFNSFLFFRSGGRSTTPCLPLDTSLHEREFGEATSKDDGVSKDDGLSHCPK